MHIIITKKMNSFIIYVVLIIASVFAIFPIYWAFISSLKPFNEALFFPPTFFPKNFTMDNYYEIITRYQFHKHIFVTFLVGIGTIVFSLSVAIHGAYALSKWKVRRKSLIMFLILATSMIPQISVLLPLYSFTVRLNIYDTLLGLVIVYSAWLVPAEVWFLKNIFDGIPTALEEAAMIDGCTKIGAFYKVILPNSKIGLVSVIIFAFVKVWTDFLFSQTLILSKDKRLVNVALYGFLSQFGIQWTQLMAATILSSLPIILIFLVLQRFYISGFISGAVKE
ncbi:MAG: multiple sugar transport system permease protein [Candidatus Atribacteria bacterium]|nr:multiple sugar transport system permease protein [Candidatus Atribacteria bacterium]